MRKTISLIFVLAAAMFGQVVQYSSNKAPTGGPAASRPSACAKGQTYIATDTGVLSYCSASGNPGTWANVSGGGGATDAGISFSDITTNNASTSKHGFAPKLDGVVTHFYNGQGGWTTPAGGGGGYPTGLCTVTLSATPNFDASTCSAFTLTLGATAVTGPTLTGATAGQPLYFIIKQDSTGGRSYTWPANVSGACAVSPTLSVSTFVTAIYDGTNAVATDCTTTDTPLLIAGPTRTTPATPTSGLVCWFDTTANDFKCKDSSANVFAAVKTAASGSTGQFVSYVDVNGVPQTATAAVPVASGTAALGTSAISSATCATVVTVSATGVATTDVIQFTPNADISGVTGYTPATTGGLTILPYPTANNVNFKVCNWTSGSITPGAVTLNWRVAR